MARSLKNYVVTVYFKNDSRKADLQVKVLAFNKLMALQHFLFNHVDELSDFLAYSIKEVK